MACRGVGVGPHSKFLQTSNKNSKNKYSMHHMKTSWCVNFYLYSKSCNIHYKLFNLVRTRPWHRVFLFFKPGTVFVGRKEITFLISRSWWATLMAMPIALEGYLMWCQKAASSKVDGIMKELVIPHSKFLSLLLLRVLKHFQLVQQVKSLLLSNLKHKHCTRNKRSG